MGIIHPPWISCQDFAKYTFNYCDHFGDKKILIRLCKICFQEMDRIRIYHESGKDPHDLKNVFRDVTKDLKQSFTLLEKDLKNMGIDIHTLSNPPKDTFSPHRFQIYKLVEKYCSLIKEIVENITSTQYEINAITNIVYLDALVHSQTYCQAKIGRALFSRHEDVSKSREVRSYDGETSALLCCLATHRNSLVLQELSQQKSLPSHYRKKLLKASEISSNLTHLIQSEFYPDYEIDFDTEIGGLLLV